ncbi:ArsR/SmtB family transcription factor [Lapidilactobacillus bayanensis]|uniref:ArsR/SmtB family transcription factor n=1 Tax=Lapidilactobacillus bayanensis TaxID=2485998 RepID=UPI001CDBB1DA|nr:metalloregulator ArsR/SmtB family transcription factor [Lapidilactobacillus bayanensis]
MSMKKSVTALKNSFTDCQEMFEALGDVNRQNILLVLCDTTCSTGLRVGAITAAVNLSRPAVSHHLKILRAAKLVSVRHEGAMNFYYADIQTNFDKLQTLLTNLATLKENTIHHD